MQFLKEIAAVTRLLGASSVIVVGIAGVVAVLVSILAMVAGLSQLMSSNGSPDRAIVISTVSSFGILKPTGKVLYVRQSTDVTFSSSHVTSSKSARLTPWSASALLN